MMSGPITPGLKLMLWATPCLTLYIGLSYALGNPRRYTSPAYAPAKLLLDMHWWGLVFLLVAVANLVLVATNRPKPAIIAICIGMGLYLFWSVVFFSSLVSPFTPPPAPGYPLLVAVLHLAMLMSLTGTALHLPRRLRRWLRGRRRRG